MRTPPVSDEALEYAAQLIEQSSLLDIAGIWAKRKRAREDAALRMRSREELRAEMAAHLRAMKSRPDLDADAVLERVVEWSAKSDFGMCLTEAWPLAWKGWLNIEATILCNSNSIPPQTRYSITLTDRGEKVIAERRARLTAACPENARKMPVK